MAATTHSTTENTSPNASDAMMWLFDRSIEPLVLIEITTDLVVDVNKAAQQLIGIQREGLAGLRCADLFQLEIHQLMEVRSIELYPLSDNSIQCNVSCEFVDRSVPSYAMVSLQPISSPDASPVGMSPVCASASGEQRGVSEQGVSCGNVSQDVSNLRSLLDDLGAIVWEATLPFQGITYISKQLTPILGYSVEEWIRDPMSWENSILPEDREQTVAACVAFTARGENHRLEYRSKHADGHSVWIDDRVSVVSDATGTPILMRGLMIDISARKEAEEAIRRQRELHQLLVDNAPVCIHSLDASGNLESMNVTGLGLVGADSADEIRGRRYLDFVAESDQERIGELLAQAYNGQSSSFQFTCLTKSGDRRFDSNFIPITEPDGSVCKIIGTSEDVTQSQETLERLRIRERAIDSTSLGILLVDVQDSKCELVFCNPAFQNVTGFLPNQVLGTDGSELIVDDSGLTMFQLLTATMQSEQSKSVVHRSSPDGSEVRYNEISVSPVRDHHSQLTHVVCFINDITDRVSIETRLRQSEHLFRTLSEHSPNGVLLCDMRGSVSYINEEGTHIVGCSDAECMGDGWLSFLHADDRVKIIAEFERLIDAGLPFTAEVRVQQPDQSQTWVYFRANPRRDEDGELFGYVGSMVDITQRKRDERDLIQSEQRFRNLVDSDPEAIFLYDIDEDRFVDWNQNAVELFRLDDDAMRTTRLSQLLPTLQPDGTNSTEAAWSKAKLALNGETVIFDIFHLDALGRQFPCEVRLVNFPSPKQNLLRASLTDVSELRASQRRSTCVRVATERFSDAMYVIGLNGRIVDVNQSACDQLGYSRPELLAMYVWEIKQDFRSEEWSELWNRVKNSKQFTVEAVHVRKDGTHFCVEVSAAYANTDEELLVSIARDITLRNADDARLREHERQLAQVSRQLVMGELVAGIAHEVNQPLYSIMNFSKASRTRLSGVQELLDDEAQEGTSISSGNRITEIKSRLNEISRWNSQVVTATDSAGSIIRRMANFVSKHTPTVVPAKINEAIEDAVGLLAHQIRHSDVSLSTKLDESDVTVRIDRVQIQQIIVNLVINAIEAIESSKSLRREVTICTKVQGSGVLLEVADSGPGFPSESGNNYIDAFASTKEDSMGMGLAIVNTIVESFDGHLTITKSEAGGATIRISMPLSREVENV